MSACIGNTLVNLPIDSDTVDSFADLYRREGVETERFRGRQLPDGRIELESGEERLEGCRRAGIATVYVEVTDASDAEMIRAWWLATIGRERLSPVDRAKLLRAALNEPGAAGRTVAARAHVQRTGDLPQYLALLELPKVVQERANSDRDIWRSLAALAKLKDQALVEELAKYVAHKRISEAGTRDLVTRRNALTDLGPRVKNIPTFRSYTGWDRARLGFPSGSRDWRQYRDTHTEFALIWESLGTSRLLGPEPRPDPEDQNRAKRELGLVQIEALARAIREDLKGVELLERAIANSRGGPASGHRPSDAA